MNNNFEEIIKNSIIYKKISQTYLLSASSKNIDLTKYVIFFINLVNGEKFSSLKDITFGEMYYKIEEKDDSIKKDDVLNDTCESIDEILEQCLKLVVDYEEKYNQKIPIFVAGGIFTGRDIAKYVKQGASGVQIGTRFIATEECDAHEKYKEMFVKAKREDIIIVKSPAGFPGRAIRNKFTERLDKDGRIPVKYCVDCILPCNPKNTVYCITDALIRAVKGDVENGLIFSGTNAYRIDKITTVKELISELVSEANNELR